MLLDQKRSSILIAGANSLDQQFKRQITHEFIQLRFLPGIT
jgi:hypothetical protein